MRQALCEWYRRVARDLPWRRTRDPYRIWLSEAMLQQTRVDTVMPYYERFLARFPTVHALADAPEQDVLHAWAGLGYYSRARSLKRAAEVIVRDHGGRLPDDPAALGRLPGIGPYTVGAIRSIAFGARAPLVDGNVARVFSRLTARAELTPAQLWRLADELVPEEAPDVFNQALMELGATCCMPRRPTCERCPVAGECGARRAGNPEAYPAPKRRAPPKIVRAIGAVVTRGVRPQRLLVLRRPERELLGGLWLIPTAPGDAPEGLAQSLEAEIGATLRPAGEIGSVRHLFTHRDLTLSLHRFDAGAKPSRAPAPRSDARWCSREELEELPLSGLMRKVLKAIDATPATSPRRIR
jgi:A/G-specific adenine glycosylase